MRGVTEVTVQLFVKMEFEVLLIILLGIWTVFIYVHYTYFLQIKAESADANLLPIYLYYKYNTLIQSVWLYELVFRGSSVFQIQQYSQTKKKIK